MDGEQVLARHKFARQRTINFQNVSFKILEGTDLYSCFPPHFFKTGFFFEVRFSNATLARTPLIHGS